MNLKFPLQYDVPIEFSDLLDDPDSIISCLPRVENAEDIGDGKTRITMEVVQFTPLVKYQPVGIVKIVREGDQLRWDPCQCDQSKGTLSGNATANPDGSTHINCVLEINDPSLPQVWTPLLSFYLNGWAKRLIDEFKAKWAAA